MKHVILRKLMLAMALLTSLPSFAYDLFIDGIYYYVNVSDFTCEVTNNGSNSYSGDIIIPKTISYKSKNLTITSINSYAFRDCSNLTSIIIGDSIKTIEDHAFYNCSSLTSITIPSSVIRIDDYAFSGCSSLKELTIEDGTNTLSLGDASYSYTYDGWTSNYDRGLFYTSPIETVYIGRNLNCDCYPFYDNLEREGNVNIKEATIGNFVTQINYNTFYGCKGLTTLNLGSSVTNIGSNAFSNCPSITTINSYNPIPPKGADFVKQVYMDAAVKVPIGSLALYQAANGWKTFWDLSESNFSGIKSTMSDSDINISVKNRNIIIHGLDNANIKIFSANGQCIYSGTSTTIPITTSGLYVVKVKDKIFKVLL